MNRVDTDNAARCGFDWPATETELHSYLDAVAYAVDLANRGRVRDGYAYLLAGSMEASTGARHAPWSEALGECYDSAIARFRAHFDLPPLEVKPVGAQASPVLAGGPMLVQSP